MRARIACVAVACECAVEWCEDRHAVRGYKGRGGKLWPGGCVRPGLLESYSEHRNNIAIENKFLNTWAFDDHPSAALMLASKTSIYPSRRVHVNIERWPR